MITVIKLFKNLLWGLFDGLGSPNKFSFNSLKKFLTLIIIIPSLHYNNWNNSGVRPTIDKIIDLPLC